MFIIVNQSIKPQLLKPLYFDAEGSEGKGASKTLTRVEGRYLVNDELKFVETLKEDIDDFVENLLSESVLILPPFLSKYRYLAHKVVDEYFFPCLCSFSIGQEEDRRIVIGWTSVITRCCLPYKCVHEKLADLFSIEKSCICIEKLKTLNPNSASSSLHVHKKKAVMKDFKAGRGKCSVASLEKKYAGGSQANLKEKQKRPDKQLYVPRALRGVESKSVSLNEIKSENLGQKNSKRTSTEHSTKVTDITSSSSSIVSDSSSKIILKSNCMSKSEDSENVIDSSAVITSSSSEVIKNCASQNTLTSSASSVVSESVDQKNIHGNDSCVCSQTLILNNNHYENYALPISTSSIISQKVSEWGKECCVMEDISTDSVERIKEEIGSESCYTSDFKDDETSCLVLNASNDSLDCKNNEHDNENVVNISSASNIESLNISHKSLEMDEHLESSPSCSLLDKSLEMNEQLQAFSNSSILDDSLEMVKHLEASASSNILGNSLDKHLEASATTSDIVDKSVEVSENLQTSTSSNLLAEKTEDSWESMFDDDGECLNSEFVKEKRGFLISKPTWNKQQVVHKDAEVVPYAKMRSSYFLVKSPFNLFTQFAVKLDHPDLSTFVSELVLFVENVI
ncbi:coiled-coil domain-containing protein R3HCC1L [Trichonephila clavata]|uniref:Coiled-coil domain-containing protein R3HCC1L n=1 Tax=Trichonephila clavata TaxID=2740835 RepID=A0A8X6IR54_TRICU|nr:coiled-coil domain-containing protein R3HCC1L [Trichonephila clavata]